MIALDTNVLVRYMMQDDPKQSPRATRLIEALTGEEPGFVPVVALVEVVWVLSGSYGLDRAQVSEALDGLLRSRELRLDRADLVVQALRRFSAGGADFADCLIERIAANAGCTDTMTFDTGAAQSAGMTLIRA
jgi:predicted nucleic-acid-binding protein